MLNSWSRQSTQKDGRKILLPSDSASQTVRGTDSESIRLRLRRGSKPTPGAQTVYMAIPDYVSDKGLCILALETWGSKIAAKNTKNKNAPTGKIYFNMKCNFFKKLRNKINQSVGLGVACAGAGVHWNRRRRLLGITCIAVHCGGSSVEHNPHQRFTRWPWGGGQAPTSPTE